MHNSDNEVLELINKLYTKTEFKNSMLRILAKLQESGNLNSNHTIYLMRNILYVFTKHVKEQTTDFLLTREQFELLYHELLKIIIELSKINTQKINEEKIELIIRKFLLALSKTIKERNKHDKEEANLRKEDIKNIQSNLRKAIIYEIYKFTNPKINRGENKLENFTNKILKNSMTEAKEFDNNLSSDLNPNTYTSIIKGKSSFRNNGRGK